MKLFNNIIGYDDTKKTLERLIDVLNNKDKYEKLGSSIPHGLFMEGNPGTGKTTFALSILDNVINRNKYILRKDESNGSFIKKIKDTFTKAIDNQPSIILLDDLDKFAKHEEYSSNEEEYVVVQSQLDRIKNDDIFVIATVNEDDNLPESLIRSGRFDIHLIIKNPNQSDSLKIIDYYLKKKKIDKDVNTNDISKILVGSSCADLEKVCNQAGIYAGFNNKESIGMDELVRASLELKYDTNVEDINKDDKYSLNVAYHEAGHALVGHILEPGSISFITIAKSDSQTRGITIHHDNENYFSDIDFMITRIKTLLAGKAATEIIYHKCDVGATSDIERAYRIAERLIDDYCMNDFHSHTFYNRHGNKTYQYKDEEITKLISSYYQEVKNILIDNKSTLDKLANELNNKKILFSNEIDNIIKGV